MLDPLLKVFAPKKYFALASDRVSSLTMAQIFKDSVDSTGLLLSNLELLMDSTVSPWILAGLYNRGQTINVPGLRDCLVSYFKAASACGEFSNVSHDIAILLNNAMIQSDNVKLICNGKFYALDFILCEPNPNSIFSRNYEHLVFNGCNTEDCLQIDSRECDT